jgi:hypothetical protein
MWPIHAVHGAYKPTVKVQVEGKTDKKINVQQLTVTMSTGTKLFYEYPIIILSTGHIANYFLIWLAIWLS